MSAKLDAFRREVFGKKVAVLGVGVSNKPLIAMLLNFGADVTACDKKEELLPEFMCLARAGAKFNLGPGYLNNLNDFDIIFKTPGIHPDIPQLKNLTNVKITSEMEAFFDVCPCKIIGVTGSDGKTTTSTLIYNMLKEEGHKCYLGGNIGTPLLPIANTMREGEFAVVELSSFQLLTMKKSPDVAVITNISPNHLNYHADMDEYVGAKKNIFEYQDSEGTLVLNADNEITAQFESCAKGNAVMFSREKEIENGVYLKDGKIICMGEEILDISQILIRGIHNVENFMTAIAAVYPFVSKETIVHVAETFAGVEHRIEFVREVDGVKFYNDSIASSPARTRAGLNSFDKKVILIAGGADKNIPFDTLGEDIKEKVKRLYLIGATAEKIKAAVIKAYDGKKTLPILMYPTLERTVKEAYMAAEAGDVVLMSPACTSFDMYANFEERGKRFKEIVKGL